MKGIKTVSAVRSALAQLEGKVAGLEEMVRKQEKRVQTGLSRQSDLFNAKPANVNSGAAAAAIDQSALARKLDMAIEKVEQLLREG